MAEPRAYRYDVFISHADADRAWVEGYLLDALEAASVRVHSEEAFRLGVPRILEFERAIQQSQRTLLILSPAYLAEGFSQFTDLLAQSYGLETATWPVIPLILHPVQLPPRLAMLTALDATDPSRHEEILARLCAELARTLPTPAPPPPCPYPGMVPFRADDARFFYGREDEIEELWRRLRHQRYLYVIGPSGCGKSSLVFAGLIPRLHERQPGHWLVREMRPGATPSASLEEALGVDDTPEHADWQTAVDDLLAHHAPCQRLLLVVDQFEELFAQASKEEQAAFITAIRALRAVQSCTLVITLRADFYPDLMTSDLWPVQAAERLEIAPLRGDRLREAIALPAQRQGVHLEAGLLERLMADGAEEPGALPMLQQTMQLLWVQMIRRLLSLRAYERLGGPNRSGLAVAVATKADATLVELLPEQQALARRIFLRLVQFGEGRPDTRRQQPVSALCAASDDPSEFDRTLEHLVRNRLLTLSGEAVADERRKTEDERPATGDGQPASFGLRPSSSLVDIAHEALISGWPVLQGWLDERREAEQTRRRLEDKAAEWVRLGRGSSGLLDEVELAEAERWLVSPDAVDLGYGEALPALVQASRTAIEEVEREREAARQRELAQAKALAEEQKRRAEAERQRAEEQARTSRRLRVLAGVLAVVFLLAMGAAMFAMGKQQEAEQQARLARSGQLATQSQAVLGRHPQRSLLLAVEALNVTLWAGEPRVPAAEDALRQALANAGGRVLCGHEGSINAVAISPDNHWLVTGSSDTTARLWDLTTPDPAAAPIVLRGHEISITAVAISPDNHWLVTGSEDDSTARLWDLTDPDPAAAPIVLRGHEGFITAVAISPDNHWLVTGSGDSTARLWDLTVPDPAAAPIVLRGHEGSITAVAISPDNHWLVTGSWDSTARLWDLTVPDPAAAPIVLRGHEDLIRAVAISSDNHWLVTGSWDTTARLWDLTVPDPAAAPIVLRGHEDSINAVAISLDNHWLVTGSGDTTARLWDLTVPDPAAAPIVLRGHEDSINAVAISLDNHWLVTGSGDTTARLWDLTTPDPAAAPILLRGHERFITAVAISPDNHWLVTGSADSTARLWDLTAPDPAAAPIVLRGHEGPIWAVAISPDNHWLVTGSADSTARLWDLTAPDPTAAAIVLRGHEELITAVAISPDNHWLVTGSWDTTARLWDLTAPDPAAAPIILRGHEELITAVAISPDNHWLVTGSWDSTARLWDLTVPDPAATAIVLRGHEGGIYAVASVAISPDNHWLVTGSWDTTVRLWNLRLEELIDLACRTAGRNLTRAEWTQYFSGQEYRKTCARWPLDGE